MISRIFARRSKTLACSWFFISMLIDSNFSIPSMDYIMSFRYPPYTVRWDIAKHEQIHLCFFTPIRQEKKLKTFTKFMYPSLPPRTAAGGHLPPMRWGIWLTASVFAAFSVVLIGRSHLGNAWVHFCCEWEVTVSNFAISRRFHCFASLSAEQLLRSCPITSLVVSAMTWRMVVSKYAAMPVTLTSIHNFWNSFVTYGKRIGNNG